METQTSNSIKHANYQEQFKRLNSALKNHFFLEAMFIEYAIMEDRSEAILRYENNFITSKNFVSIDRKIMKIKTIAREKKSLASRYFNDEFLDELLLWKGKRNQVMHALMKQHLTSDELEQLAMQGKALASILRDKATNYKRMVERRNKA